MNRLFTVILATIFLALPRPSAARDPAANPVKITLQLNWVPEPEFGGIYQAAQDGSFAKHNLDVHIIAGGAGAPTWQLVAEGKTDFAIASADEVLIARQKQADVVAIFATYQTCPQGIMVHASRGFTVISDVFKGGTLAVEPGLPYVNFLKNKYGFGKIKVVAYDGGPAAFLNDRNFSQQCFVTSEPIAAKKAGSDPQVFLIADAGYNPYTGVVITRTRFAGEHPDVVRSMFTALQEGWKSYLDNPTRANAAMHKLNSEMDLPTFAAAAAAQNNLIRTEETDRHGLGCMLLASWQQLADQLVQLGVIKQAPPPRDCFIDLTARN
jgi:NitT/TauT family transport system substrate-binding protein